MNNNYVKLLNNLQNLKLEQIKDNLDIDKLYQEVDKCILLCSNCHAEEHEKN